VLITLRDDRHLLNDPAGLYNDAWMAAHYGNVATRDKPSTLYPDGFSASRFVEVIEGEAVWDESVR
jgi:hypothetical protein